MLSIRAIQSYLIGDSDSFSFEHRLINAYGAFTVLLSFIGIILNYLFHVGAVVLLTSAGCFLISGIAYYLSKFKGRYPIARHILTATLFAVLNILWFHSGSSNGPVLYLYFLLLSIILLAYDGLTRLAVILLFIFNIVVLYTIEYNYPEWISGHITGDQRLSYIYATIILYFLIGSGIILFAKINYLREKRKAEQSERLKSIFLSNISHDIRTPMNSIMGFSQLLAESEKAEDRRKYASVILENGQTLMNLIQDLLDISSLEAGSLKLILKPVHINNVLREIKRTFDQQIEIQNKYNLKIYLEEDLEDLHIITDGLRLQQILQHLLSNALKFTDQGFIRFGYKTEDGMVRFYVTDTGTGISRSDQKRLFECFVKPCGDRSLSRSGTGIGLAITKNLVDLLGGKIWFESKPGVGSTFYFSLPNIEPQGVEEPEYRLTEGEEYHWKGKKVLIVEDDKTSAMLLENMITAAGAEAVLAGHGQEALNALEQSGPFHLVLMDVSMPVMDGITATKKIKELYPGLPVFIITVHANEADRRKIKDSGCNEFFIKPLDIDSFLEAVDEVFDLQDQNS